VVQDPAAPHLSASISAHRRRHAEGEREEEEEEGSVCGIEGVREEDNCTDTDTGREDLREIILTHTNAHTHTHTHLHSKGEKDP
jgi:hypothetical protein